MKSKIAKAIITIIAILSIMYAEYRYIMINQHISKGDNNTIYVEIFGQVDEYEIDN